MKGEARVKGGNVDLAHLRQVLAEVEAIRTDFYRVKDEMARLEAERDQLAATLNGYRTWVPPGHFYSPVPAIADVRRNEARIYAEPSREVPGVDLNEEEQRRMLASFKAFYGEMPFRDERTEGLRYFFKNPNYSYGDAIVLYSMIRHLRPGRIVEIGSGYSSCVTLDTNELFFDNAIDCTFIEPYPNLMLSLLKPGDRERVTVIPTPLQDVSTAVFEDLAEGDVLFIDSTHVSKIDSDVNHIFFRILPVLRSGVYIHIHDVFYPFEYPKDWIYEGRAWNEDYVLRAFLQYNTAFKIVFFNSFMARFHREEIQRDLPLFLNGGIGSIWLRRQ